MGRTDDWELKIACYSDFRVDPHGFVAVKHRFADILKRYEGRNHALADKKYLIEKREYCLKLES